MTTTLTRLPRTPWRVAKDTMHALQALVAKAYGRPIGGLKTDLDVNGRKVIFFHNPKSGGTSLGKFLNVSRRTHVRPYEILSEKAWINSFVIVVVRDPFERFLSCYYGNIVRPGSNGLTKRYGDKLKSATPFEFLRVLSDNPKFGGLQSQWTNYPSGIKPQADLILKFEEIQNWPEILKFHGIDVSGRELKHHNRSERSTSDHLTRLGMTEMDFAALKGEVREFYDEDYQQFKYD